MGNFLTYKDVPIFANFVTENQSDVSTASFLFAASDVGINLSPNLSANRFLGKIQSRNDFSISGPMEAKISMTFFPLIEAVAEAELNIQKSNQLAFFGLTGDFVNGHTIRVSNYLFRRSYLQNYSMKINSFQPVSISANFISYDSSAINNLEMTSLSTSPIAKNNAKPHYKVLHGLSTRIEDPSLLLPTTKTNVEVNVDCQRTPIYTLGSRIPSNVVLNTVERTTTIQGESIGNAINLSGSNPGATNIYFQPLDVEISPSEASNVLKFDINGRIISQDVSISQGNAVNGRVVIKEIIL